MLKIGTRVKLIQPVDNYPDILAHVGLTGTLVEIDDENSYWVKLDQNFPELNEWDNKLQIWDWSKEGEHRQIDHPESYLEAIA